MLSIVDYGVGNLYSLQCSLQHLGVESEVTSDPERLHRADRLILPGVGAFGDAIEKLRACGLEDVVKAEARAGKPLLGICLGMQLLFDESMEYGRHAGLSLIKGRVVSLADHLPQGFKVPHMGWNSLELLRPDDSLFHGIKTGDYVYYVHSFYAADCEEALCAVSDYGGVKVAGVVRNENVCGTQFHPEKSGGIGLQILKNFCEGSL